MLLLLLLLLLYLHRCYFGNCFSENDNNDNHVMLYISIEYRPSIEGVDR